MFSASLFGQTDVLGNIAMGNNVGEGASETVTIDDVSDNEVFAIGKNVVIKEQAKGVLVFGGNVTIIGRVEGDVAAIGGSIDQKASGFIGGDVIVLGGKYKHELDLPLRAPESETVMFAGYEEELRAAAQNPTELLAPSFSLGFFAMRLLSVLFWFVIGLAVTTIAPGAISRAVARVQISSLKVVGIGFVGMLLCTVGVVACLGLLPNHIAVVIGLMAAAMLTLAFVFGRIALQATIGKWLIKLFYPNGQRSETLALLLGTVATVVLLSLPYLWAISLFVMLIISLGLVLTAASSKEWKNN